MMEIQVHSPRKCVWAYNIKTEYVVFKVKQQNTAWTSRLMNLRSGVRIKISLSLIAYFSADCCLS